MLRTHTAGELNRNHIDKEATLCGWVDRIRDIGQLFFVSIRDRYGVTQCVIEPSENEELGQQLKGLGLEDCIQISGKVKAREQKDINSQLPTGEIEFIIHSLKVLNQCADLPFQVKDDVKVSDELRLKHRYLDLRRPKMQNNLAIRHRVIQAARQALCELNFLEIETPLLVRSTPEGARDFVVPSRLHPGSFYALPQSPQLYKQMLMVSGCDRYYQFAPAFRDEDLRADRVPVHTQIDMEMTFVSESDVFHAVEHYIKRIFKDVAGKSISTPIQVMPYREAMDKYGSDKPDIRFGLQLNNLTELAKKTDFAVFKDAESVRGLCVPDGGALSRKDIDQLTELAKSKSAKGLAWTRVKDDDFSGGVAKFLQPIKADLETVLQPKEGSLLFFVADSNKVSCDALGAVRLALGKKLNLINTEEHAFLWVNEFPMFEWDEDAGCFQAMHHLFTQPMEEDLEFLESEPGKVRGQLYDLVLNGVELLSGSIRINRPEIQKKVLEIVNMPKEEAESKFGFLTEAFKYGAPPHGGSAMGLDRLVAILCGQDSIREVIAYPPNNSGIFPLDGAPARVSDAQLNELQLALKPKNTD